MRARKAAAASLTHDSIAAGALALIDRDGLDAFSIRKLGGELGCEGMALYWYYPSKDALLDAVVELLMRDVGRVLDDKARDWVAVLRAVAHGYRDIARKHPHAFPLLATRRFATEGTYEFLDRLFELARMHGIDDKTTARYYRVVSSFCNGFALNELAPPPVPPRKQFARLAAVSAHLAPRHLDELFEFGLELQLSALSRESKARK